MSVDILGQVVTNAEAWFNNSLRPRKPEGSLGRTDQDSHLDSHTPPELCRPNLTSDGLYVSIAVRLKHKSLYLFEGTTASAAVRFGSVVLLNVLGCRLTY